MVTFLPLLLFFLFFIVDLLLGGKKNATDGMVFPLHPFNTFPLAGNRMKDSGDKKLFCE
jgi:hypothetical protein